MNLPRLLTFPVLALVMSTAASADDWKPEEGFTSLFNGTDLTGWVIFGGQPFDPGSPGACQRCAQLLSAERDDPPGD